MHGAQRAAVARFVAVVVATSAVFWVLGFLDQGYLVLPGLPVSALMFVAPLIATGAALGPTGVAQTFATHRRANRGPAGLGLLGRIGRSLAWAPLMPAVVFATYPLQRWAGRDMPVFTVDWAGAALLLVLFLVTATVEEIGWTWFMTERLRHRWRPLWTGVAVGALWAFVHVVPYAQAGNSWSWIVAQCVFTVVFRIVLVQAYGRSGRALSVPVVLHATYNVAWGLYPTEGSHYSPLLTALLTAAVALALAGMARSPSLVDRPAAG